MSFVNIFISKQSNIYVKNNQLIICNSDGEYIYNPTTINTIMIENTQSIISTYALQLLSDNNVIVYVCNLKHLPNSILIPINGYCKTLHSIKLQLSISKPLKKQLWQSIISNKIDSQARVMELIGYNEIANKLYILSKNVLSDDSNNLEAVAASLYFKYYLEGNKRRDNSNNINTALDYTYSIVRGMIARNISAIGLVPSLGIHHSNELNPFNLADDLLEPFRPFVDLWVYTYAYKEDLSSNLKKVLYSIVNAEIIFENKKCSLGYAIELYVNNFKKSLENDKLLMTFPYYEEALLYKYE